LVSIFVVDDTEPGTDGFRITTASSVPPPRDGRPVAADVGVRDDENGKEVEVPGGLIGKAIYPKAGFPPQAAIKVEVRELDPDPPVDFDEVGKAEARVDLACPLEDPRVLELPVEGVPAQGALAENFAVTLKYRWDVVEIEVD